MTITKLSNGTITSYRSSKNLNGKSIQLSITNYGQVLEITIKRPPNENLYKQCIGILTVIILTSLLHFYKIIGAFYYWIPALVLSLPVYEILFSVNEEKLLIMQSLGYQLETHCALGHKSHYIPWEHIRTIFINEVVSKQRVIFLLTLLTKDTNEIIPLFTETMPRLESLELVYQCIQPCHN